MDEVPNETKKSTGIGRQVCQHDYRLNEEIGIVCRSCGFVCTEIRYVSLPFVSNFNIRNAKKYLIYVVSLSCTFLIVNCCLGVTSPSEDISSIIPT